jgi:hypothetical protein
MTAAKAPAAARQLRAARRPGLGAARLLGLELRHNAIPWVLPVIAGLFWFISYRKIMAMPPQWNLRAAALQSGVVADFITPVVGAAAWMGSREARRRMTDLLTAAARPSSARLFATWAATACWALAGYLACLAAVYGPTARQTSWGGPLWWPAAVAAGFVVAITALGFAAGVLVPSRFTAPVAGIAAFFVLALSTELIVGGRSYWQISPIVSGPWETGQDAGVATFYPYLPDLAIAQLMLLGGLTIAVLGGLLLPRDSGGRRLRVAAGIAVSGLIAAGTAVRLAGTGTLDAHGMIRIPALHDAANDRSLHYRPVCGQAVVPVCLNPAYASYLPAVTSALRPALREVAGLPGAPARVSQVGASYHQGPGNSVGISPAVPGISGTPPAYHLLLSDQLLGPVMNASELASELRASADPGLIALVVGAGPQASPAQKAVAAALMADAGLPGGIGRAGAARGAGAAPGAGATPTRVRVSGSPGAGAAPTRVRVSGSGRTGGSQPGGVIVGPAGSLQPLVTEGTPAYAAAVRFAALPAPARHAWLARHLLALRAGQITLGQLP